MYVADESGRVSIPTRVHIYPGLPHGFRRWTQLHATEVFDSDSITSIHELVMGPEEAQEWETPWTIYPGHNPPLS